MGKSSILIIDDEEDLRVLLAETLSREGYEVRTAHNGAVGLDELARQVPDLLILDLRMPILDGYGVLQRIRANPEWMALPVMILSGEREPADLVRGLNLGADEYLFKPAESWELRARVAAMLRVNALRKRVVELEREKSAAQMRLAGQVCLHMMNAAQEVDGHLELELRAATPERHTQIEPVARRARELVGLLEALGEYAQLAPSAVEQVDLREILNTAAQACAADWQGSGLTVDVAVPAGLPPVRGRKFELGLAFRELFARAARAMPGGGTVRVTGASAANAVAIEVADSGSGKPESEPLETEPFCTDGAPCDRAMALPVAHAILTSHAARVEVKAVPGTGTTVRVELPSA